MKNFWEVIKPYLVLVARTTGALLLQVILVDIVVGCFVLCNLIIETSSTGRLILLVGILAVTCLLCVILQIIASKRLSLSDKKTTLQRVSIMFLAVLVITFAGGLLLCYAQFVLFDGVQALFHSLGFFGVIFCTLAIAVLFATGASSYFIYLDKKQRGIIPDGKKV